MTFIKYFVAVALVALLASTASAQSSSLPRSGITPDSPFYFLDTWGEGFGRFFAFGREAKAAKQAEHAEERLAEAQVMADEGKDEETQEAVDAYGSLISDAAANLAAAAQSGEDTSAALTDLVLRATSIHLMVLAEVYEKVPEQAKPSIERAMTQSAQGQQTALNALSGEQKEEVTEQVQQQRQEVEQRLDILRQQGAVIRGVPFGSDEADSAPTGGAPAR